MIQTARLTILPLTLAQLLLHIEGRNRLERAMGLPNGKRETSDLLRRILLKFTVPRLRDSRLDPLYHTLWIGIDRNTRLIVAEAKFKGEPDEDQTVEIGYGTHPAFQRQGYMTELVGGMLDWAGQQPGIRRVEAETAVENVASQKVVEKNGFRLFDRREEMLWWEWLPEPLLTFDSHGCLIPYQAIRASQQLVERVFATNQHRHELWVQFVDFRQQLTKQNVPVFVIWINGSFATQKMHPNDIDIVCFVDAVFLNAHYRQMDQLRNRFGLLHIFFAEQHPVTDLHAEAINRIEKFKWFSLFGTKAGKEKGFIELIN